MTQVELVEVVKRYKEVLAVDHVSLTIHDQEFLVLLGPSGCGKSTILRMIAGLEPISSGEIYIEGQLVNYKAPKERNVAMVFQNYALYPHMMVQENIGFSLKLAGQARASVSDKVAEVARALQLEALLRRLPGQLSGGQRQRVALGRAIIRNPSVFLMDEPLSNLDAALRVQTRSELLKLHERLQATVVYVTHDQVEAMTMGHRIVVMNRGIIQQVGPPQDVYDMPVNLFVAGFLGSPSINLFKGRLERHDQGWLFSNSWLRLLLAEEFGARLAALDQDPRGEVTLGIRPEDLGLAASGVEADFYGEVHFLEPVGSDKYVSLRVGEEELMLRTAPRLTLQKGQQIGLTLAWSRLHLFDAAGRNLFADSRAAVAEVASR
jgi:multiple sugar transport system ATP-binding protein